MKMKIKRNSGVSVLAILGVAGGALLASIPAQAASLNGTIGLAASIKIVGTGQCAKIGSTTLAVPCTDAMADTTKPLTTFDFQDLTGAPGLPAAPFNGELSVTGATGDFLNFAPPPPAFGQVKDLPVGTDFTPNDWLQLFYSASGGVIPGSGLPILAYSADLLQLDFPNYTPTSTGVTVDLGYKLKITRTTDGAVGLGSGTFSGDILFINTICGAGSGGASICTPAIVQSFLATPGSMIPNGIGPFLSASTTLEVEGVPVPEPSSLMGMLAVGLLSSGMLVRKAKKK